MILRIKKVNPGIDSFRFGDFFCPGPEALNHGREGRTNKIRIGIIVCLIFQPTDRGFRLCGWKDK